MGASISSRIPRCSAASRRDAQASEPERPFWRAHCGETAQPAEDDMIAALDSIKMLELLSKINDLEHELRTVEISTKVTSPARGRASLATH
jgi:hypothetical protein